MRVLFILALIGVLAGCKKEKEETAELGSCRAVKPTNGLRKMGDYGWQYSNSTGTRIHMEFKAGELLFVNLKSHEYSIFDLQFWGGTYVNGQPILTIQSENLNGKHVKDRVGNNRTFIYPDGTKITMVSDGPYTAVTAISIYDGDIVHHFNTACGVWEYSANDGAAAKLFEEQQPDGETSALEILDDGLLWCNIYTEDTPGDRVVDRVSLARIFFARPNEVQDYYDDPRFGHTRAPLNH